MHVVSESDVRTVLSLSDLVLVVADAVRAQGRGDVERPSRPHFPVGFRPGEEPAGTGMAMPAYVHGAGYYATKLVGVHGANPDRGLPTVHATVALTDAHTGEPVAYLAGRTLTNARTGCIGAIAVRELAPTAGAVGILGAGTQARWQARAIAAVADPTDYRIYSPGDSRERCAADLRERGLSARTVDSPRGVVEGADVVVTATTSNEPVFPGGALADGALVVAVGAYTAETRELDAHTFERASRVFADVPEEAAQTGDVRNADLDAGDLRDLSSAFDDAPTGDIAVVESVGSAVFDAAAAGHVYGRVREAGLGTDLEL